MKITRDLPFKRVFIRDLRSAFYQKGVRDLGDGCAAILFGAMLGADRALSFSRLTVLSAEGRERVGETRWKSMESATPHYLDLRDYLETVPPETIPRTDIYMGAYDERDLNHVAEVEDLIPDCEVHLIPVQGHNVARPLRDEGKLRGILEDAVDRSSE